MSYLLTPGIDKKARTPENILAEAAEFFQVNVKYILKKERSRDRVIIRYHIFNAMRDKYRWQLVKIGKVFNQDHTTVVHGIKTLRNLMKVYPDIHEDYESLSNHLNKTIR